MGGSRKHNDRRDRSPRRDRDRDRRRDSHSRERDRRDRDRDRDRDRGRDRDRDRRKDHHRDDRVREKEDRYYKDERRDRDRDRDRRYEDERGARSRDPYSSSSRRPREERSRPGASFRFDSPPKDDEEQPSFMEALLAGQNQNENPDAPGESNLYTQIQKIQKAQTDKIDRKLYVGNLPQGITQQILLATMNEAYMQLGLETPANESGPPILSAWISSDSHYAFVEFRSAEEANNGFKLQGMIINGNEIKIGRPKSYEGTMQQIYSAAQLTSLPTTTVSTIAGMRPQPTTTGEQYHSLEDPTTQGTRLGGSLSTGYQIPLPSRVIRLGNVADFKTTNQMEDFKILYSDMYDELSQWGDVVEIKIPKMKFVDRSEENNQKDREKLEAEAATEERKAAADPRYVKQSERRKARLLKEKGGQEMDKYADERNYDHVPGFGSCFAQFTSEESCLKAIQGLQGVKYNERRVQCSYWLENWFFNDIFNDDGVLPELEQQNTLSKEFEGLANLPIEFTEERQSKPIKVSNK